MKIQSIPQLFTLTKVASYQQIAQMLKIKKELVEFYIIEAIRDGIIKAKLDQFEETVLIKYVFNLFQSCEFQMAQRKGKSKTAERLNKGYREVGVNIKLMMIKN